MRDAAPPSGHKLNDHRWFTLQALADAIVPPSTEHGVPGAGDKQICKEVLGDVGERLPRLVEVLDMIDDMAIAAGAESFVSLPADKREQLARKFRDMHPRPADRLANWVMQCYYRDDRVLVSLGVAPRAPFPDGYDVQNGDWSKLDRVRARSPFYRRTT